MAKSSMIGSLRIALGMDSAQFQAGVANANKSLDGLAKRASEFGVKFGLALTGAAAAFGTFMKMTAASAAKTGDVADRFGVAVESLQELRHAADMSGIGLENFDTAFRRFLRRSSEAARGTGAAKDAFAELGVALTDNQKRMRNAEDIFNDVADAINKLKDPTNKLRLAFKIFDVDGAAMVKMFENGSAGIKAFREQARELGIVLSQDTVRSAQRFTDSLNLMGKLAEGFRNRIFAAVLPAFEHLAARIFDVARNTKVFDGVAAAISGTLNLLARGIGFVIDNLDHLIDLFKIFVGAKIVMFLASAAGSMLAFARAVATTGAAMAVFTRITKTKLTMLALLGAVIAKVTGTYDDLAAWIQRAGQAVMDALPEGLRSGIEDLGNSLRSLFGDINEMNTETARSFGTYLSVYDEVVSSFGGVSTAAKAATDNLQAMRQEGEQLTISLMTPLERYRDTIANLNILLDQGAISQETYNRAVFQAQEAFAQAEAAGRQTESVFQQIGQTMAHSFANAFTSIIDGSQKAGDAVVGLLRQLANLLLNRAFQMLFNMMFPGSGGFSVGGFVPTPGVGMYAKGTDSAKRGLAIVGEQGPELVRFRGGEQVIPNHELDGLGGGGNVMNVNVHVSGARGNAEIQEMVERGVRSGLSQYDQTLPTRVQKILIDPRAR